MGGIFSGVMNAQAEKHQQFMLESQRMQLERQMIMQNVMRERAMAMQFARSQELFGWVLSWGVLMGIGSTVHAYRTKNFAFIGPNFPIIGVIAYLGDQAYGDKLERIRKAADNMLLQEAHLFELPLGPVTFEEIEARRMNLKEESRFRPNEVFL